MKTFRPGLYAFASLLILASPRWLRADAIESHPAGEQLKHIFAAPIPSDFKPTDITRNDYLKLIAGNIDFFKRHQNQAGAIIDPVSKGERQYSTPAFAAAAGLLVKEADRKDLLDPASRAMSFALTALVQKKAADHHPDFYIPMLVHAHRFLKDVVSPEQSQRWAEQFRKINPETMYRADLRGMNWNIVSSSGELLRRHDKLLAEGQRAKQMGYLENCLAGHLKTLTPLGLFEDPGAPMAYDGFSRLWLEDVFADDAYQGAHAAQIENFLRTGGLSTILLLSPSGEWASGGRSGLHNWTDVQTAAICEVNAAYWKKRSRDDVAGAFKRAAHLAFDSVRRWQRPSGELWIIKNRAEPTERLAFEHYSNHSQYNLLPMAMLAIAYSRADESIAERPSPSEVGGYIFDARQTFHKVAAAAGGYYVLIDTAADDHYNATGLQRVHKAGVPFPALSDTAPPERAYGPKESPKAPLALGIEWKVGKSADSPWLSLADFAGSSKAKRKVQSADLKIHATSVQGVDFEVTYTLADDESAGARRVTERYVLSGDGVEFNSTVTGNAVAFRAHLPVLVSDGAADTSVNLKDSAVSVQLSGSTTSIEFDAADGVEPLQLTGPRIVTHNGYVRKAVLGLRKNTITAKIKLQQK